MHIFIMPAALTTCQKCKKPVRPHTICKYCGYYKGQEFINVLGKLTKKEKKMREREMKETEKEQKTPARNASHSDAGGEKPMNMEELSKKN